MATSRTGPRRRRRGSGTAMGVGDELVVRVVPCSFDGDQAGSYFGALEANRTLHAIYALDNGTVTLDNLSNTGQSGLSVESKVYNLAGTVLDDQKASNTTLASQQGKHSPPRSCGLVCWGAVTGVQDPARGSER